VIVAFTLQWLRAETFQGRWAGLLAVGETSRLAPMITAQLDDVPLWEGIGHDGQISFAVARDPFGSSVPAALDDPGYRYRRILYPLLASLGGALGPGPTLVGLVTWGAIGLGLGAAGMSLMADSWALPVWLPSLLLLNPGTWLGVQMLTTDPLALGLAALGIALVQRSTWIAGSVLLALSALTKDQYAACALAAAIVIWLSGRRSRGLRVLLISIVPLAAWATYTSLRLGGGTRGNLGVPFTGLFEAAQTAWPHLEAPEPFYLLIALSGWMVAIAGVVVARLPMLRWLCIFWVVLGAVVSHLVWDLGNNAARTLVPAGVFGLTAIIARRSQGRRTALDPGQFPEELPGVAL
jgi:hypothetical protein